MPVRPNERFPWRSKNDQGPIEQERQASRSRDRPAYLFINKSVNSKSVRNGKADDTQKTINSYVQRFKHRPQGQEEQDIESSLAQNGPSRRRSYCTHETCTLRHAHPQQERRTMRLAAPGREPTHRHGLGYVIDTQGITTPGECSSGLVPILYSNNFKEGDACDPFSSTAVPIDISNHGILQLLSHLGRKAPPNSRYIDKANKPHLSKPFHETPDIIRSSQPYETHLCALLTCVPLQRTTLYGADSVVRPESSELVKSTALRALQRYISNLSPGMIDSQMFVDLLFLSFAEFYRQDHAAVRTHLHIITHIVKSLGGFGNVPRYAWEGCCFMEISFALRTGQVPVFQMTGDPGPIKHSRWVQIDAAMQPHSSDIKTLGRGFKDPLQHGFFVDDVTRPIIEALISDVVVLEYIRNDVNALASDSRWACFRSRATIHRLLSLKRCDKLSSLQEWRVECVTTSMVMLLAHENLCISPLWYGKAIVAQLEGPLHASNSNFSHEGGWGAHNHMLLWIVITGMWAATGSSEEAWFLAEAIRGCTLLGLDSYDKLCRMMNSFIWIEQFQSPTLMTLAGHVLSAKADCTESEAIIESEPWSGIRNSGG